MDLDHVCISLLMWQYPTRQTLRYSSDLDYLPIWVLACPSLLRQTLRYSVDLDHVPILVLTWSNLTRQMLKYSRDLDHMRIFFAYMASFFATNCLRLAITYFGLTTIFLSLWVSFDLATAWFGLATLNTYLFFEGFHKHFHLLACDCLPILWTIDMTFLAYLFGLVISSESAPGASISVFGVTEIFVGFSTTFLGANRGGGACTTWLHISHFTKYPIEMSLP